MHDPKKVVHALVWVSLHPREEVPVGWKARSSYFGHRLFPDAVEGVSADVQRAELEKGAPSPDTSASLHQPMSLGTGLDGGIRARMEREDQRPNAAPAVR